jgi:predicted amidophosphoribosyltransferase
MNNEISVAVCPVCHQSILATYYFCPNCGNNLKETPTAISPLVQAGLYALAIFLPPLGLWPGIKYVMKKNQQAKIVGAITIVLTLISTILTIWAILGFFNSYMAQMNEVLYGM